MSRIIQQTVTLSAAPDELFDIYLNSKRHGAAIDDTVSISRKEGGRFAVFDGSRRAGIC